MSSLDLLKLDDELSLPPRIAVRVVLQSERAEGLTYLVLVGGRSDLQVSVVISRSISFDHDGRSGMRRARWDVARGPVWVSVVSSTRQLQSLSVAGSCAPCPTAGLARRSGSAQKTPRLNLGRGHTCTWRGVQVVKAGWRAAEDSDE